jgi:hypothetical protein
MDGVRAPSLISVREPRGIWFGDMMIDGVTHW